MAIDDMLGRDFTAFLSSLHGPVRTRVTIVAFDPDKGWKLAAKMAGFSSPWVTFREFDAMLDAGVLEAA